MKKIKLHVMAIAMISVLAVGCSKDPAEPYDSRFAAGDAAGTIDQPRPVRGKIKKRPNNAVSGNASLYLFGPNTLVGSDSSDVDGEFVIDSVPPGVYYVVVSADGFEPVQQQFSLPETEDDYYDVGDIFLD
jgi:hypothetical protein